LGKEKEREPRGERRGFLFVEKGGKDRASIGWGENGSGWKPLWHGDDWSDRTPPEKLKNIGNYIRRGCLKNFGGEESWVHPESQTRKKGRKRAAFLKGNWVRGSREGRGGGKFSLLSRATIRVRARKGNGEGRA